MKQASLILSALALALSGCVAQTQEVAEGSGVALSLDYFGDTDVVGFHFEIRTCGGETVALQTVELSDTIFPGQISFVEAVLDENSRHIGADFFAALEPGCYKVIATPVSLIDSDRPVPSRDCKTVMKDRIRVVGNQVTDVILVSQCVGDVLGGLDTLVLLNKPPVVWAEYDDEKFNYECEPVRVCATTYDPNDDPIELVWNKESGPSVFATDIESLELIGFEEGHRVWRQCATITTRFTGTHEFTVTAYDLDAQGNRIEDRPEVPESHGQFTFPIHTNWIEEPRCWDAVNQVLVDLADIPRDPKCHRTTAQQYYCEQRHRYRDFLCDDNGVLIPQALYPVCE